MANLIAAASGNFTSASTWGVCDAASHQDAYQNIVTVTTSNQDSNSFVLGTDPVDAIALRVWARAVTPSGTFSVILRNTTTGTDVRTVTVNVADIPPTCVEAWPFILFKFSSAYTANGTDSFVVRFVSSASNQITLTRANSGGTHIDRKLRTTVTAAPGANDHLVIANELTGAGTENAIVVTMNNTATTSFGPTVSGGPPQGIVISGRGTLYWSRAGSTNFYLRFKGTLLVSGEGVLDMGQSGDPLDATSTHVFEMDSVSNLDTGVFVDGGYWYVQGPTKANRALMTADCLSSASSFTCDSTAGWESGDVLWIAGTNKVGGLENSDTVTVNSVTSGTTFTTTGAIGNARTNVAQFEPEILNLTQRVKIRGISSSLNGYVRVEGDYSLVRVRYAEIYNFGGNATDKWGVTFNQKNTSSAHFEYCSVWQMSNGAKFAYFGNTAGKGVNTNVKYCSYKATSGAANMFLHTSANMPASVNIEENYLIGNSDYVFYIRAWGFVCKNNRIGGQTTNVQHAISFLFPNSNVYLADTFAANWEGNVVHNTNMGGVLVGIENGLSFNTAQPHVFNFVLKGWKVYHTARGTATGGIDVTGVVLVCPRLEDCLVYGNDANRGGIWSRRTPYTTVVNGRMVNCKFGSTYAASQYCGIQMDAGLTEWKLENCDFGVVDTGVSAHSACDFFFGTDAGATGKIIGSNVRVTAGTVVSNLSGNHATPESYVRLNRYGRTSGDHRSWFYYGTIRSDSAIFNLSAPSERITPNSASVKLESSPRQKTVESGQTVNVSVVVRKSAAGDGAAYNGAQPRLIVRRTYEAGITVDTVLDTMTASTGTWETLTGTTATASDDAVLEFFVDCDGTAGWINVDDWS